MNNTIANNQLADYPAVANFLDYVDNQTRGLIGTNNFYSVTLDSYLEKENAIWTEDGIIFKSVQDKMFFLLRWS